MISITPTPNLSASLKHIQTALILGIDPGKTTGAVLLRVKRGNLKESELLKAVQFEYEDRMPAIRALFSDLVIHDNPFIAMEDYRIYPKVDQTGSPVWSCRIIGIVEAFAEFEGFKDYRISLQMANTIHNSQAKKYSGSNMIYTPYEQHKLILQQKRHAADAYAHAQRFALLNFNH